MQRNTSGLRCSAHAQHRLVVQGQLLVIDGVAQIGFELAFHAKLLGHALVEEPVGAPAGGLCRVERHVARPEQEFGIVAVVGSERNADADADTDMLTVDFIGLRKDLAEAGSQCHRLLGRAGIGEQDPVFIASQPGNEAGCSHRRPEAVGDRLQQRIADPMAQRVVYDLEPIEVQVEQGKTLVLVVTIGLGTSPDDALFHLFRKWRRLEGRSEHLLKPAAQPLPDLVPAGDVCEGAYKAAVRKCGAPHFEYRTVRTGTLIRPQPADRVALREILQCLDTLSAMQ